jgi:rhodanese-related sulfurtransferase
LFSITDESAFVKRLVAGFGTFPTYFSRLPDFNRRGPTRYDSLPQLAVLTTEALDQLITNGAAVVDARPAARFATGHIPGALSDTLRPVFGTWLGWLVEPNRQLVFVLDDDQDRDDLVRQCLDVGHENLVGELAGGMQAWKEAGRPVRTISFVNANDAAGQIIDVRQANEYASGHVPGAVNIELEAVSKTDIANGPITLMCGHGERAMTGASILARRRLADLAVINGGADSWFASTGQQLTIER